MTILVEMFGGEEQFVGACDVLWRGRFRRDGTLVLNSFQLLSARLRFYGIRADDDTADAIDEFDVKVLRPLDVLH